jgi:hypothetical protein
MNEPAEDISEVMKSRGKGEKDKKSKERKKRESRSDKEKYINHVAPASAFVLTEEALLAMSQAALEVAPKIDTFQSIEDDGYIQEKKGVESRANEENGRDVLIADDWYSLASSKAKSRRSSSSSKKTQKSVNSSVSMSQKAFMASNQSALNVMDSFEPIEEEPVEQDEVKVIFSEDEVSDINDRTVDRTVSEASTQPYTNTEMTQRKSSPVTETLMGSRFGQNTIDVAMKMESARSAREERKRIAQEPTPRTSNESTVPDDQGSLSENGAKDSCQPQPTAAVDTPKSEDASQISLSSSSSSWENEQIIDDQIVKKPIEIDKDLGHLDSMMFQGKGLEQLTMSDTMNSTTKRPEIVTGLTRSNNSEDSVNTHTSSYSSEHTQDLTPAKSMGPVWQKAIDDAQKALHPKSEKKSQALVHVEDDETVADDETVFSVRPGFNKERLQYAGKYN